MVPGMTPAHSQSAWAPESAEPRVRVPARAGEDAWSGRSHGRRDFLLDWFWNGSWLGEVRRLGRAGRRIHGRGRRGLPRRGDRWKRRRRVRGNHLAHTASGRMDDWLGIRGPRQSRFRLTEIGLGPCQSHNSQAGTQHGQGSQTIAPTHPHGTPPRSRPLNKAAIPPMQSLPQRGRTIATTPGRSRRIGRENHSGHPQRAEHSEPLMIDLEVQPLPRGQFTCHGGLLIACKAAAR